MPVKAAVKEATKGVVHGESSISKGDYGAAPPPPPPPAAPWSSTRGLIAVGLSAGLICTLLLGLYSGPEEGE